MPITAKQNPRISAGAVEHGAVDLTPYLAEGETITGTPTADEVEMIDEVTTPVAYGDLELDEVTVNSAKIRILLADVCPGKAVTWRVKGQQEGSRYLVRITLDTSAGRTLVVVCPFRCV